MTALLRLNELSEALSWLMQESGEGWTLNRLLAEAYRLGVTLHAVPPEDATPDIWVFELGQGLVKKFSGLPWCLAKLYPVHIFQLWQMKRTFTVHAAGGEVEGEYRWFRETVQVTTDNVRITDDSLMRIRVAYLEPPSREDTAATPDAGPHNPVQEGQDNGLRQKQIVAILNAANVLKYDVLNVPDGGQKQIMVACFENSPNHFIGRDGKPSDHSFRAAWRVAVQQGKAKMKNHNLFARRGR